MKYDLVILGAGAGGCYTAIRLAEFHPGASIHILEAARNPLSKVEISGGGRCNVTHACFDPQQLIMHYPRGGKELLEAFFRFQPSDMVKWFEKKGIRLKTESDGRIFPVTNLSSTIVNCFLHEMRKNNIRLSLSTRALDWMYDEEAKQWTIKLYDGSLLQSRFLLISSGSDQRVWNALKEGGHTIVPPVPSLFTFNIRDKILVELMGISKSFAHVSIPAFGLKSSGPLLITHWGLSGPAVLKLSAWGARELYRCGYVFDLHVNWIGDKGIEETTTFLQKLILENPKRQVRKITIPDFPARLWQYLCVKAGITEFMSGAEFGKKQLKKMTEVLTDDVYRVTGKSTFKEEFVTAGGVDLSDVDMQNFESKKQPGLFMVGEVLNIDAVTGGFNFQAAWTGAFMAANAISKRLD